MPHKIKLYLNVNDVLDLLYYTHNWRALNVKIFLYTKNKDRRYQSILKGILMLNMKERKKIVKPREKPKRYSHQGVFYYTQGVSNEKSYKIIC